MPDVGLTLSMAAEIIGGDFFPRSAGDALLPGIFRVDSRAVGEGDAFIAIKGARVDGHDHIADAVRAGASLALVESDRYAEREYEMKSLGIPLLIAGAGDTTETAAVALARHWLSTVAPRTIGITGSVGKTTTRDLLARAMRSRYRTHAASKSYNTLIGCSMTILAMPRDTEVLILEFGTNHPGEIGALVDQFPVETAIITDVSPAHLEGLGSIEGVCAAKMEIASSRRLRDFIYNGDSELLRGAVSRIPASARRIAVGMDARISDICAQDIDCSIGRDGSASIELDICVHGERRLRLRAPIYGGHNARNIAYAYAAASIHGVSDDEIARAIAGASTPSGRCALRATDWGYLIDDSYNANPTSMGGALSSLISLRLPSGGRKIAILGGMRELGETSLLWHERVAAHADVLDEVHLIGGEWVTVDASPHLFKWRDADQFAERYDRDGLAGAAVLVKGSRYYELERVVDLLSGMKGGDLS